MSAPAVARRSAKRERNDSRCSEIGTATVRDDSSASFATSDRLERRLASRGADLP